MNDAISRQQDLENIAEALPQMVWTANVKGNATYCNQRWTDYTGLTVKDSLGRAFSIAIHPEDIENARDSWTRSLETHEVFNEELRLRSKHGTYRWFLVRALYLPNSKTETKWIGSCTDIQEQREALHRAELAAMEFQTMADLLPDMVFTTDATGKINYVNNEFSRYTGREYELGGEPTQTNELIHPDDLEQVQRAGIEGGAFERVPRPITLEYRVRRHDGVYRWFHVRAVPQFDEFGNLERWIGTATDIQDQKEAMKILLERQELQKKLLDQERYVADTLQKQLLPQKLPIISELILDAVYIPATETGAVGGDWYDAIELEKGLIAVDIGDVGGHGLEAASLMGIARQGFRGAAIEPGMRPEVAMKRVNRLVQLRGPNLVTAAFGLIDLRANTFTYSTAGHPPLLASRKNCEMMWLPYDGFPLGLDSAAEYTSFKIDFHPGDTLVLYTDGVTEYNRDIFNGEERLKKAVEYACEFRPPSPARAIQERVLGDNSPLDDIAILYIHREEIVTIIDK